VTEEIGQRISAALAVAQSVRVSLDNPEDQARLSKARLIEAVRSQFSMTLVNLERFHAFWSPALSRFYARSAPLNLPPEACRTSARGRPPIPSDALFIDTYTRPISPERFFEDLCDALALADRIAI
jgi:hypothetical protein